MFSYVISIPYHILKKSLYEYIPTTLIFQACVKKNLFLIILKPKNKSKETSLFEMNKQLKIYENN